MVEQTTDESSPATLLGLRLLPLSQLTLSDVISVMCLDVNVGRVGHLLRATDDIHEQRADDGLCDSCGTEWPCYLHALVQDIVAAWIDEHVS